jgi:hypothetical protein
MEDFISLGFADVAVFVRYGADLHSKATSRADLEWESPS